MKKAISTLLLLLVVSFGYSQKNKKGDKPNILVIWGDDIGWSNPSIYNMGMMGYKTPNIDKIGQDGMMFTDAHTNSSVCTPTRYGILTGQYAWRTRLKNGVLWSYDKPLITVSSGSVMFYDARVSINKSKNSIKIKRINEPIEITYFKK